MNETRTRAQKRLTRALAWHDVLRGREEDWQHAPDGHMAKHEMLVILQEASRDALEEIAISRREAEAEQE